MPLEREREEKRRKNREKVIIGEREIGRDQCRMIHISVLKSVVGFCYVDVNVDFQLL